MTRVVSIYLPDLPTDRIRRDDPSIPPEQAIVVIARSGSKRWVSAADAAAKRAGVRVGMPAAKAQALFRGLMMVDADLQLDATATYELYPHLPTLFELFEVSIARNDDVLVWHFDRVVDLVQHVISDGVRLGEFPQQDCHGNAVFFVLSIGSIWHPTLIAAGSETMNAKHSDLLNFSVCALRDGFKASTFTGQQ